MNTKRLKLTGIILCLAVLCTCFTFVFNVKSAHATPTSQKEIFLPTSEIENAQLYPVVDFSYFNGNYGIIQKESADKNIVSFFTNYGAFTLDEADVQNADKISFINENLAVVLSKNILYKVDISSSTVLPLEYGQILTGNTFDLNNNYLATLTGEENNGSIDVYSISGTSLSYLSSVKGPQANKPISGKKPVAINNQNVFFVISNTICYKPLNDSIAQPIELTNASPSKMIASDEFLFFIEDGKIFKIDLSNCDKTELSLNKTLYDNYSKYDLGNFKETYSSIFFKNENLLISDGTETVQEFRVNGDKLEFTGFAIAKDNTAYNRISVSASKIERNDNYLAVKDGNKLCVIKNVDGFDGKDQKYFKNFFELGNFDKFCVGEGVILLTYTDNTINTIKILDIESGNLTNAIQIPNGDIMDVSYGNGGFYVATNVSTTSYVYKVLLDGTLSNDVKTMATAVRLYARDQANNEYIIDEAGKLYENDLQTVICENVSGTTEIQIDLDGTPYLLHENKIKTIVNGVLAPVHSDEVKTFSLSYDKKEVYFIKDGEEFIYSTTSLGNHAVEDIIIPPEYKLTDSNAYVESLAVCTVNINANVYSVGDDNAKFTFNGISEKENQYLFICDIIVGDTEMTALAGQNGIVLTYKSFTEKTSATFYSYPSETYVTTGVNVYYLPLITMDEKFVLMNENQVIRLEKGTKITPLKSFSAVDRDYYYAEITLGEKTYKGYIPKEFTVDVLAEDKTHINFTLSKVNATSVYLDAELITEITSLEKDTSVRVISVNDGVAEIYFSSGETWIKGYVSESALIVEQNNSIRNAIMLLIAVTCVCSTIIYFMFKKKS